jgi:hypothetical protein
MGICQRCSNTYEGCFPAWDLHLNQKDTNHEQRPKQQKRIEEEAVKNHARKKDGQKGEENGEVEPWNPQSITGPGFWIRMVHWNTENHPTNNIGYLRQCLIRIT